MHYIFKILSFHFLMPQFDIFSFFSQLFWVFTCFLILYLSICFYILPALAVTLKIRKRQLNKAVFGTSSSNISMQNNFSTSINALIVNYISKNKLDSFLSQNSAIFGSNLSTFFSIFIISTLKFKRDLRLLTVFYKARLFSMLYI